MREGQRYSTAISRYADVLRQFGAAAQRGHAATLAADDVQHADVEQGRRSSQSRVSLRPRQEAGGSPPLDLDPVPLDIKPRILTTAIDWKTMERLRSMRALAVAAHFQLDHVPCGPRDRRATSVPPVADLAARGRRRWGIPARPRSTAWRRPSSTRS